jgi:hypothetical protein
MPIASNQFTLSLGTAIQIVAPDNMPQHVTIHEADHSANTTAFLGGPNVGTANGLHIHSADTLQFEIGPRDEIWAVGSQGSPVLHVITITKDD